VHKLNNNRWGFTIVELMIVVAIIALVAAIAIPNFLRSRKRSQASRVLEDMRIVDSAIDQYAIEYDKTPNQAVNWTDIKAYLKTGSKLYNSGGMDMLGFTINGGSFTVDGVPRISSSTYNALSDVAPSDYWSPFY
jgi:prepilin-type N-terminal cleavage/methylation domain-containing protein